MNLLQKVAQVSRATRRFDGDYYGTFLDIVGGLELPKPKLEDGEEDDEDLDFENFAFSEVTDDVITFSAGGDWQEPLIITLKYDQATDKIYVAEHEEGYEDNYTIKFNEIMGAVILPGKESTVVETKIQPAKARLANDKIVAVFNVNPTAEEVERIERMKHMRKEATTVFELTKGLTPEQRKQQANYIRTVETLAGYVLELTNDLP